MAKSKSTADDVAERLTTPVPRVPPIPPEDFLSCGITVLNLAATGRPDAFVPKGKYVYIVGDSSAGKSWLAFNLLAEAARNKQFDNHRFVFDNAERGAMMDIPRYFGAAVAERLEPPRGDTHDPEYSATVQQFFFNVDEAIDAGPCIYILDSVDAIGADEDDEQFEGEKRAYEQGKPAPGSYGMAKPKYISRHINRVAQRLTENGSIMVLISQTRDKIGGHIPGLKTRSGGRALKFFARLELWMSVKGPIKKTVMGKEREIGSHLLIDIQKNHINGWEGKVPLIPFHRQLGFDSIGADIDFLVDEKHWSKGKGESKIEADEFDFVGTRDALITYIESTNSEQSLRAIVAHKWREIEEACSIQRKAKYQ